MRRASAAVGILTGLLILVWVGQAQDPAEHPSLFPSSSSEDAAVGCLTCHEAKKTGKVTHPALEMGCESCHGVDADEDWTEVFLVEEGNGLCFTCHGDKRPEPSQIALHQPVRRALCVTCHDPHSSETESLLLRPAEGKTADTNLCLSCHTDIKSQIEKKNLHGALEFGCSTCHTTHKSDPPGTQQGAYHLNEAPPGLCLTCHDAEDATLTTAHSGQPFQTAVCTGCHNPHGSDAPKLINNFIHGAMEMGCETCHEEPQDGKVVLQEGAGRDMCLMCHGSIEEEMQAAKLIHAPLEAENGCVACHSPHAATYKKQLRQGPVKTCLSCHTELAEARASKAYLHPPVFELACHTCHGPHTGERKRRLHAEVNDLCLACHGAQVSKALQAGESIQLVEGGTVVTAKSLEGIRLLPVRPGQTVNHPMRGHPFGGEFEIKGDTKKISCLTCHLPHAADGSRRRFVTETASSMKVCMECH